MITVNRILDADRRCQSCGKLAKYELRIEKENGFSDIIPLCYGCLDVTYDRLKKIEEAGK